ncbi:HAD family hydrolase [Alkalicoccobacillus porphyridii]|uniref:HAD family hydrolase n=1 Tax=Alkalicoccobacillus porphyridii TaxID=2597270 RepID=A0A553ZX77_9BACI|nr:HAD family hydrolase [Alkalicoccobacillus porphyridii]TSB46051.1 HAD family hydrolase [Alkalicoccobacillus porphyridii]
MVKAILFDFDGTLANTLPLCFKAFQHVFQSFDEIEHTDDAIKDMFGPSETGIINKNLKHKDTSRAIELYYETYTLSHQELVAEFPEMLNLLQDLKDKGYLLGIVTGKARRSLEISLEALNMSSLFDTVITGDDVIQAKPHPEGIELALKKLKIDKEEVIFLGDSDADILAGKEAAISTMAVNWLPDYQATFKVKPDHLLQHVDELRAVIKSI